MSCYIEFVVTTDIHKFGYKSLPAKVQAFCDKCTTQSNLEDRRKIVKRRKKHKSFRCSGNKNAFKNGMQDSTGCTATHTEKQKE